MPKAEVSLKRDRNVSIKTLPPGPSGYLLFTMDRLQSQPLEYLGEMWHRYGDLVRLPVMPGLNIMLSTHPDHAEHILSTYADRYGKSDFFLNAMGAVQGAGLFTSEGELWRSQRKLAQPAFHQAQLIKLHSVMLSCVQSLIREWEEKPEEEVIDIADEMT